MIIAIAGFPVGNVHLQRFRPSPVNAISRGASTIRIQ